MAATGSWDQPQMRLEADTPRSGTEILEALVWAGAELLGRRSWGGSIEKALRRLGEAAGLSRVYVYGKAARADGTSVIHLFAEWSVADVGGIGQGDRGSDGDLDERFEPWEHVLRSGAVISGTAPERPNPEREALENMDVVSFAAVPIFANGDWWGFLGLHDCVNERGWAAPELDALKAAAALLGGVIERRAFDREGREIEARYRTLVEHIPAVTYVDAYADEDPATSIPIYVSPQVESLLGYSVEEWMSDPGLWEKVLHPDDTHPATQAAWKTTVSGVPYNIEYRMLHRDGRVVWVRDDAYIRRDDWGHRDVWQGLWHDITASKQAEERLMETEAKHRALIEQIPAVVYLAEYGNQGEWLYMSPQLEQMLGYTPEEWMEHPEPFSTHLHPEDLERVLAEEEASWATGEPLSTEYRIHARDGRMLWIHDQAALVKTETGRPLYWQGLMHDVTDQKLAQERIAFLAYHDEMTGLPNRLMFEEILNIGLERARRHGFAVAVLSLDLDQFKLVNDSLGHELGDELLLAVSRRLQQESRETDMVSRQGGDEFQLLLADLDFGTEEDLQVTAESVAARVQAALGEPFRLAGTELYVSASVGISIYPFHAEDAPTLLKNAEIAMYESKRIGPGGHAMYSVGGTDALSRLSMATRLRKAVERQDWTLHYQPIVDLRTGSPRGVEALVRWSEPGRDLIYPGEFIPLAEEMGLIGDIGDWVIEELCRQSRIWSEKGLELEIAFNVSPQQLLDPQIVERLLRRLEETGVDPRTVVVEITESTAMADPSDTNRVLEQLDRGGVRLAIDDFGTGYSSLSRLKDLPVSILKIDRSFIRDIPNEPHASNMVKAVIQLANGLEMTPLAEGVETEEQRRFLLEQGCVVGQGFLFSRPIPPAELEEWVARASDVHS
ncbi:MAG: EAL domain-containing protein [Actinomycetota bacterium]|nr:EAL domain-containing protein [Actinomycetota bacterium]